MSREPSSQERKPDPRRVLRSHALAVDLLGVDFVPRRKISPTIEQGSTDSRDARQVRAEPASTQSALVETKPSSVGSKPSSVLSAADAAPRRIPAAESFIPAGDSHLDLAPNSPDTFSPLPKLAAQQAQTWLDRLRARYEADAPHKAFVTDHHNIVFGEGNPIARLMFVGEAPGAEEDKTGRPFVGRAGQLLDRMILAMGLKREDVYIANVLKTRPPNNATPTFEEAATCSPYLFEQIAIIRPEAIVTLGLPASRLLLNTSAPMHQLRGRWSSFTIPRRLPHPETHPVASEDAAQASAIPVMPTFHPAYLLRSYTPENRAKVWSDLQMVLDRLGLPRPKTGNG